MAGFLTTHVLDTARGCPAAGLRSRSTGSAGTAPQDRRGRDQCRRSHRYADPARGGVRTGTYELVFFAGDYLRATGQDGAEPLFLDQVPIRFGMAEADHYHVPLLLSPYGYSTYRGS
jgi:5-hydroxyisourate hydrolase